MMSFLKICYFLYKFIRITRTERNSFYQKNPDIKCYNTNREDFLLNLSLNKRVLHFGFLDHPFLENKIKENGLLHLKLKEKAKFLFGVDISSQDLDIYRGKTNDFNNIIADITDPCIDLSIYKMEFDIILFPEILEHLKNPGLALSNLRKIAQINKRALVCITVPNAFYFTSFCAALNGYEIVHSDHYFYFSPYTIKKILTDTGFTDFRLSLYISRDMEKVPGIAKNGLIMLCYPL